MGEKTRFSRDHLWKPAFLWNIFAILSTIPGFSRSLVCRAINPEYFVESIFSSDQVLVAQFLFVTPTSGLFSIGSLAVLWSLYEFGEGVVASLIGMHATDSSPWFTLARVR